MALHGNWLVYVKDDDGKLHLWAKCDSWSDAHDVGEAFVKEFPEVKGFAVMELFGVDD